MKSSYALLRQKEYEWNADDTDRTDKRGFIF